MQATDGLAPLAPSDTGSRLVVERIDPIGDVRWIAYEEAALTLHDGVKALEAYLKRRHQRGWFIWKTGWMQFTCIRYDGNTCEGEYLRVYLEAMTVAEN